MVRILVILLSLAGMLTAFQNCGSGGTLTMEKSAFASSSFSKLLGSCNAVMASKMCDERWSVDAGDTAAFQASCMSGYQSFECPSTPDKLGVCEMVQNNQLRRLYYYAGFTQGLPQADELAQAKANCKGTWQ